MCYITQYNKDNPKGTERNFGILFLRYRGGKPMNISKFTQKSIQAVQDLEKVAYEYGNQESRAGASAVCVC